MSRLRIPLWQIAVASFLVLVLAATSAPAWVAALLLEAATTGAVSLEDPQGSAWDARAAALVIRPGRQPALRFTALRWRLRPARLLAGELAAEVSLADPALAGDALLVRDFAALEVRDAAFRLPAATLARLFPAMVWLQPGGELELSTPALRLAAPLPEGEARLAWSDATIALAPGVTLGDYRLALASRAGVVSGNLETASGALLLAGRGHWSPATGGEASGTARVAPGAESSLRAVVELLGAPNPDGSRPWRIPLPPLRAH